MSDTALDVSGRKLGDFVVRDRIGEGGFGVVHRAEQPLLGREAVVKLLHSRFRASPVLIQRFLREARLASRLDHPYAAHTYAFGVEQDGLMWIAMERVRGTPLDQLLASGGALPLVQLVPLVERISEVIHAAHEQGIIHRDIKPANVMVLSRAGKLLPKLLDFGIAKAVADAAPGELLQPSRTEPELDVEASDDTLDIGATAPATPPSAESPGGPGVLTELGQLMGSPPYMAPERWNGGGSDARADLYALGVLTYEALAGHRPFSSKTLPGLGLAHVHGAIPPLGDRFPAALDDVFRKILAKKPEDRYPDAVAFAAAFRSAAGLSASAEELPRLDEALRARLVADSPQPIAEAVAELDAARNAHQARDAMAAVVATVIRMLGLVALACRGRIGPGGSADAPEVVSLIRDLRRHGLSDTAWLQLTRRLVAPFIGRHELHPMPELVDLFAGDLDPFADLLADGSATDPTVRGSELQALDGLRRRLPALTRLLEAISFLADYPLVVGQRGSAELWMGVRRTRRRAAAVFPAPDDDQASLVDATGRVIVPLSPLIQTGPPAPGAAAEMFLLEGPGRHGARLTAHPAGFDRYDDAPWIWLAESLLVPDDDLSDTVDERPPYRGLEPFTTADAELFVGRAREIEAVVNRLRTQTLVTIVGPSGAGKSSLVQAGVVPGLPAGWRAVIVRPGPAPMTALDARLARDDIDPDAMPDGEVLVLVIDQLEELFTQCHDADERMRYAERLSLLARSADDPVRIVLTLRDDFLVRANELPPLRERLATGMVLLSTPAPAELERLLVEPAGRAGYVFDDPALPRRMVAEVVDLPGALPLLSFTASRMWELRDRHFKHLPSRVYDALGGVGGALAQHAEHTLEALGVEQQRMVREIFRNLVTADGTRAALNREQLAQLVGDGGDPVIEKLIAARLLIAAESEHGHERIEIVHESLLTAWPRIVDWRRQDAEGARLRDQLRAAASQWVDRGRPSGLLWRDDALAEYRVWRGRWAGRLTDDEEAFARTSVTDAARSRRLRRGAIAAALLVLGTAVVVLAWSGQRVQDLADAERERVVAQFVEQGRQTLLQGRAARALVWLHEARKQGSRDPALPYMLALAQRPVAAQLRSFEGHTEQIRELDLSADGRFAVTASTDRTARVWELASGRSFVLAGATDALWVAAFDPQGSRVLTAGVDGRVRIYDLAGKQLRALDAGGFVFAAEWSPDGTRIASAGETAEASVWDAATGKLLHRLPHSGRVSAIAMAPDGTLACGTFGSEVTLWDSASGKKLASLAGHRDTIRAAAFSADGRWLATTSLDGVTIVWDLVTRDLEFELRQHNGWVERPAFSPDNRWLATASPDRTGRLWSLTDGDSRCMLESHAGAVRSIEFDPTGRRMVTAGADGVAIVWDTATCAQLGTLEGHAGPVLRAKFAADGTVITASFDGTMKQWSADSGPLEAILAGHRGDISGGGFSRDGARVYTWSSDGTIRVWNASGSAVTTLVGHHGAVNDVAWGKDGTRLASGGEDGTVRIWDVDQGSAVHVFRAHRGPVARVAFSPDDSRLMSAGHDGVLHTWEAATGIEEHVVRAHEHRVNVVAFSANGRRVVSADFAGVTKLWDASGRLVRTLSTPGTVTDAVFSPDGSLLATASTDNRARVWELDTGRALELAHGGRVSSVRFDDQGARVVSASEDGTVRIWDARSGARLLLLEGHASPVFAARFSPDGDLVVSAGSDRTARVWEAHTGREIARLVGHRFAVGGVEFDPSGTRVLTTGFDKTAMLWSIAPAADSIEQTDRLLRCFVPLVLANDRLEPRRPTAHDCSPDRARSAELTMQALHTLQSMQGSSRSSLLISEELALVLLMQEQNR